MEMYIIVPTNLQTKRTILMEMTVIKQNAVFKEIRSHVSQMN